MKPLNSLLLLLVPISAALAQQPVLRQNSTYTPNGTSAAATGVITKLRSFVDVVDFTASGWLSDQNPTSNPRRPLPLYTRVTTVGITIGYPATDMQQKDVARSLSRALGKVSIDSTLEPFSDLSEALVIIVGLR